MHRFSSSSDSEVAPVEKRRRRSRDPRWSVAIALLSTVVVFGGLVLLVVNSPGWPAVHESFFNWDEFRASFGEVAHAFKLNIKIFCVAEVFVLFFALILALIRSLPGPVFLPLRVLAIAYTDLFRGIPTVLVIVTLGFGVPALGIGPDFLRSTFLWGVVSLILIYTAYVSEVYRAGIESVHPSQELAARSLGLTRWQTMRHVIVPQAIRRVVPPLLNDFIGMQKDTALVGVLGAIEAYKAASIEIDATFNYTAYLVAAFLFVLITVPQTRFTDWLVARDRKRMQSGRLVG